MGKYFLLLVVPLTLLVPSCWATVDPKVIYDAFEEGPFFVNQTDFYHLANPSIDHNLGVFAPNEPGNFPVFYFVTGFGGVAPSFMYTQFLGRIASHGFVAVGIWREENPVNSFNESWFDNTIEFVENRLERSLHREGYDPGMHVDYERSFIAGHSGGGHVPVTQLQAHCLNFIGQILLSPVDGADPFGIRPIFVITPGEKVNYTIPTLQIVTGLDPVPSNVTGVACAPEELSGHRFYDAMTGPIWYINATAYGHGDFLDPFFENFLEIIQFCAFDHDTPKEPYISFEAGSIVSFMKGVLDPGKDCGYFDNLEVSGILGINTLNEHAPNGWRRCSPLQCLNIV